MNSFGKRLKLIDIILLFSILGIMTPLFSCSGVFAQEILKVSPSEIFEGLPGTSPTPIPSPLPNPLTIEPAGKPDITTSSVSLQMIAQVPTPKRTPIVFDNTALEQYTKEHPTNPAEPSSNTPVPTPNTLRASSFTMVETSSEPPPPKPDIETLRQKLYEDSSPAPKSEILFIPLSIDFQGGDSRWGESGATLILDYQCSSLFASLSIAPAGREKEAIIILKNAKSRERCVVTEGEYLVTGKFWLPNIKNEVIKVSFGKHALKNYATYLLTFDNGLGQIIKEEIDYRIQEKMKILSRERKERLP